MLQRWNSHRIATEGDSNDDRDAQEQASQIQKVNARLEEQASQIQKMSAQLNVTKPATRVVLNNQ